MSLNSKPDRNLTSEVAALRGKKTFVNEAGNVSKEVTESSDKKTAGNIANLRHEANILGHLNKVGIGGVPQLLGFESSRVSAKLDMSLIPGRTMEQMEEAGDKFDPEKASELVGGLLNKKREVAAAGVTIVDLNEGSFLIEGYSGSEVGIGLIDYEYAVTEESLGDSQVQARLNQWYHARNLGVFIAQQEAGGDIDFDQQTLNQIEERQAAILGLSHFLGRPEGWDVDLDQLSEQDRAAYERHAQCVSNFLGGYPVENLPKGMETDDLIAASIPNALSFITLPYLLKDRGIDMEQSQVEELQEILRYDLDLDKEESESLIN